MSSILIVLADYRVITWLIQSTDSATLHRRRYYLLSPQLYCLPTCGISPAGPAWRSCSPRSPARPGSRGQSRGPGHDGTQCDVTRSTPPPDLCHQRPPRVPLAGVPAALPVPGAHHLLVDADSDAGRGVPLLAHRAAHRHHLRRLQHLGQGGGVSSYRGAPATAAPWAW